MQILKRFGNTVKNRIFLAFWFPAVIVLFIIVLCFMLGGLAYVKLGLQQWVYGFIGTIATVFALSLFRKKGKSGFKKR